MHPTLGHLPVFYSVCRCGSKRQTIELLNPVNEKVGRPTWVDGPTYINNILYACVVRCARKLYLSLHAPRPGHACVSGWSHSRSAWCVACSVCVACGMWFVCGMFDCVCCRKVCDRIASFDLEAVAGCVRAPLCTAFPSVAWPARATFSVFPRSRVWCVRGGAFLSHNSPHARTAHRSTQQ